MQYIRNKKRKKIIISVIVLGSILFLTLIIAVLIDNSHRVDFEDEVMAEMICKSAHVESINKFRDEDLEKVEILNIGYTGFYDTLVDIEKCPNLKELVINYPECPTKNYYFFEKEVPGPESEERIKQIERELGSILEKCSKLEHLYISNEKGNGELHSLGFLKKGKKLKWLSLYYQSNIEYTDISECTELQYVELNGCDISDLSAISELENLVYLNLKGTNVMEIEEILKLKNLNNLDIIITNTPLAKKVEQLELIQQQFPDFKIRIE